MPREEPVRVKVTRTPLAGGASTVVENLPGAVKRILSADARLPQSIGDQSGGVLLDNTGDRFGTWASGDVLRVEAAPARDAAYTLLLEGFVGEPDQVAGIRGELSLPLVGLNAVLDQIVLPATYSYAGGTVITDIVEDVAADLLTGYTATVTADATVLAGAVEFQEGMRLRAVLDWCRRALIGATGQKWEYQVTKDGATLELRWYKRATTVQTVIRAKDLLRGARHRKGSAFDVVNEVVVTGATVPTQTVDKTGLAESGSYLIDTTTERVAQPFTALDSPLYALTTMADRSLFTDPPQLLAYVARNSDNVNQFRRNNAIGATQLRIHASFTGGTVAALTDESDATGGLLDNTLTSSYQEMLAFDLGASPPTINAIRIRSQGVGAAGTNQWKVRLAWSDDDAAWTADTNEHTAFDVSSVIDNVFPLSAPQTHRYWRVEAKETTAVANSSSVKEVGLYSYRNEARSDGTPSVLTSSDGGSRTLTKSGTVADRVTTQDKYGYGYDFSGSIANYLSRADAAYRITGDLSLTMAFEVDSIGAKQALTSCAGLGETEANNKCFCLEVLAGGELRYSHEYGAGTDFDADSTLLLTAGFHTITVRRDNTARTVVVKVDGVTYINATYTAGQVPTGGTTATFYLGIVPGAAALENPLNGGIYEFRIWNTAVLQTTLDAISDAEDWSYSGVAEGTETGLYWLGTPMPTSPDNLQHLASNTGVTVVGAESRVLFRADLQEPQSVAKLKVTHIEGTTNALVVLKWQVSADGYTWTDAAQLPISAGSVIDTVIIEVADSRYLRLVLIDARTPGSASINSNAQLLQFYYQTDSFSSPLVGDSLKGSGQSWGVEGLVQTPGLLEEKTYPAPRLTLTTGALYWLIFHAPSGASATSWWELVYGTETGASPALKSTDSGVTWSQIAAEAVLLHRLKFNNARLVGSASDAASQAKYANFVPGGVLYGSIHDESLRTQEMVDREAASLVEARSDVTPRLTVPIKFNPALQAGSRVTLHQDVTPLLGVSGDFDVVDASHHVGAQSSTVLQLGEHEPDSPLPLVAESAMQRSG